MEKIKSRKNFGKINFIGGKAGWWVDLVENRFIKLNPEGL